MNWLDIDRIYQHTSEGEARAHAYYYVYRVAQTSYWVAGRYWLGGEVDYRIKFESASQAREYCQLKDQSAVIIVGQEA